MKRPAPVPPRAGQESVWQYPRPPRVERVDRRVRIRFGGDIIVDSRDVVRVCETSHPPVYYLTLADFAPGALQSADGGSVCEWKGRAEYFDVCAGGHRAQRAAWRYPQPFPGFEVLADRVAVYAGPMDECRVDDDVVTPQPGGFYGGWITPEVVGPFKGVPGSWGW